VAKLDHLAIGVRDWRSSRDWYRDVLGFRLEFEVPQGGAQGLGVAALQDETGLTLFLDQVVGPVLSGQGSFTIQVDDVAAVFERLRGQGVGFVSPLAKQFWGYGAVLADLHGHVLHLYDPVSMAAKRG
jgi:catechol 2,3-dioxygenase-like lactoylglutathione lyase family enzyme